ncbi:MAG TPA: ABC transporter permease subunit [Polyangiales bacterium]|nr:ABC transporter permease subunit [Polyangiales bacterium]
MTAAKSTLRDIAIVAGHELTEALGSRRVLIFALLFVGGAVAGTLAFVNALEVVEAGLAKTLAVSQASKPGAMTQELMRSPEFLRMLRRLVRDAALARELASMPPLSLFYGWLGLTFMPVLVMLTAAESVSSELARGSLRFSLVRTERYAFSAGKLAGQALLMLAGVTSGAAAVWVTGYFTLSSFEAGRTAYWLVLLSLRVSIYAFAYVGVAVGLSHLTGSVPLSRALGLGSLMLFGIAYGVLRWSPFVQKNAATLAETVLVVVPQSHALSLWQPDLAERVPALVVLAALGVGYFSLGYAYRARRDV